MNQNHLEWSLTLLQMGRGAGGPHNADAGPGIMRMKKCDKYPEPP